MSRGDERFTYAVVSVEQQPRRGICRVIPGLCRREDGPGAAAGALTLDTSDPDRPVDVKLVPFYGKDGNYVGGRVTGVRPGSRLALAGLRPGDVVLGVDDAWEESVDLLRAQLRDLEGARSLDVFRAGFEAKTQLSVGG